MTLEDDLRRRAADLAARVAQQQLDGVRRPASWRAQGPPAFPRCLDCGVEITAPDATRCIDCANRRPKPTPYYARGPRRAARNEEETP